MAKFKLQKSDKNQGTHYMLIKKGHSSHKMGP